MARKPATGSAKDYTNCPNCNQEIKRNLTRHSLVPHQVLCTCGTLVELVSIRRASTIGSVNVQGVEAAGRPVA